MNQSTFQIKHAKPPTGDRHLLMLKAFRSIKITTIEKNAHLTLEPKLFTLNHLF